jgi:hypothetical protein
MRSTADLIKELEQEAGEHSSAKLVALVVGFAHTSSFVFATDVNKLEKLNEFIKQGGEPFGFICITQNGTGTGKVHVRAVAEYNKAEAIHQYLTTLAMTFGAQLEATGEGKIAVEKN